MLTFFSKEVKMVRVRDVFAFSVLVCLIIMMLEPHPVEGAEGRFPLSKCTTITSPGSYLLTNDITQTVTPCIDIQSSKVTVDLGGHSITSTVGGVSINSSGFTDITIKNGIISNANTGISLSNTTNGGSFKILNMVITDPQGNGIYITGGTGCRVNNNCSRPLIRGVTIKSNGPSGANGIRLSEVTGAVIEENIIYRLDKGIWLTATYSSIIRRNSCEKNLSNGIYLSQSEDNIIFQNTTNNNNIRGIYILQSHGNVIMNNVSSQNANDGVLLYSSNKNFLDRNMLTGNKVGVYVTDSSMNNINWTTCAANTTYGILLDTLTSNNAYSYNRCFGSGIQDGGTGNLDAGGNLP